MLVDRSRPICAVSAVVGAGAKEHVIETPDAASLIGLRFAVLGLVHGSGNEVLGRCNAESFQIGCHRDYAH